MRRAQLHFDLTAFQHNLQKVHQAAPRSKVMAVIKANAYGHGLLRAASALSVVDGFAVATIDEGLNLRQQGVSNTILILQGAATVDEYRLASRHNLTLVLHHDHQLGLVKAHKGQHPMLWLKLDTGMHRLGFNPARIKELMSHLGQNLSGVMTHFANADQPEHPTNQEQILQFTQATDSLALVRSAANSAALLTHPETQLDWVRPGIMLYGASPLSGVTAESLGIKPVMTLTAPLIAINRHLKGEAIGYGSDYRCEEDMPIGVISIGYGDGYPRHAPSGTPVLINGIECPLAGRVSMDTLTVNLRRCPDARVGDYCELWGQGLHVDRVAELAGTIGYELLCAVGRQDIAT